MPIDPSDAPPTEAAVLLVDDNPDNLTALRAVLAESDYAIETASSGPEALSKLLRTEYAVVLLDVSMPAMDGYEVAALMRRRERTLHTPIIFLTAVARDPANIERGYSMGAVDFVTKPFEPAIVRAKVAVFVDLHRSKETLRRQSKLLRESERRAFELQMAAERRASDRHYRELANAVPQIVWVADEDGNIDYWNQRWWQYTGTRDGGKADLGRVLEKSDAGRFETGWRRAIAEGRMFEDEFRLRRWDGAYRWHLCNAVPERDANGRTVAWIGTFTDIDERHQSELERARLLELETRARRDADDARRRSDFLSEITGILASSLEYGESFSKALRAIVTELCDWCIAYVIDGGVVKLVEVIHAVPDRASRAKGRIASFDLASLARSTGIGGMLLRQQPTFLHPDVAGDCLVDVLHLEPEVVDELGRGEVVCVPLVAGGRNLGILAMVRFSARAITVDEPLAADLGRRLGLALDNSRLFMQARHAVDLRDEFISVASHELKTPLTSLLLQLGVLMRQLERFTGEGVGAELARIQPVRQAAEGALRQTNRLAAMVNELLDVTRASIGRLELQREPCDLAELIGDVAARFREDADQAHTPLRVSAPASLEGMWDRSRLDQVLSNLISNAVRYGRDRPIDILVARQGSDAVVKVRDHGAGIPEALQEQIFEKYQRGVARAPGGLGLGLHIAREIVAAHGGRLVLESRPGRGSTFTVCLPLGPAAHEGPTAPAAGHRPAHRHSQADDGQRPAEP